MDDYGYESMLMDTDVCWWMMDMGYGTIMGIFDEGCLSFSLWEPHNETNFQYGGQHLEAVDIYSGYIQWVTRTNGLVASFLNGLERGKTPENKQMYLPNHAFRPFYRGSSC
jgi:hypothetical protein